MKLCALNIFLSLGAIVGGATSSAKPDFAFRNVQYFHRWSQNDQHEFTPEKQEDLEHWADMITINGYPDVHGGDDLARMANSVLENYTNHHARVLKTDSVPQTAERPAEHFIAVVFGQPAFIELAFARFKMIDGAGCSIVYSHRIYGEKIGEQMSEWLKANGGPIEKDLLEWKAMPSPASLGREVRRTRS